MDLDYQHKYLKYKKKNLNLKYKEYSGGGWLYIFYSREKKLHLMQLNKMV